MGCGESKHNVATGNLATTRRTPNSEPGRTETTTMTTTSSLSPPTAVVVPAESAMSTQAVSTEKAEAEEEANNDSVVEPSYTPSPAAAAAAAVEVKTEGGEIVVSKESSPDRYFSPTKEEALAAKRRMGSDGAYYSPRGEPETTSVKVDGETGADAPAAVATEEVVVVVKAEEGGVAEGSQGIAPAGKEEELKSKDPSDLKEDVLVEEKESKTTTVDNKNVGEGEKRNNNS